jgi:2-amino-4-hydroxy-6-hydroxymethyldihydropteridine diphosphokinase
VVLCRTALSPLAILDLAQELERRGGRRREGRNGPRTLDIDLLAYGSRILNTPRLCLPHPRLRQRRFVLAPFCEVAPDFPLPPDGTPVHRALAELAEGGKVEKITWSEEPELLA